MAKSLDKAFAGFPIYLVRNADDEERSRAELDAALQTMLTSIRVKQEGVYVQASTFGSLEGLLRLLKDHQIPVRCCHIRSGSRFLHWTNCSVRWREHRTRTS